MIGALLWKEYREGRMVWAALALLGLATVTIVPAVLELLDLAQQTPPPLVILNLLQLWMIVYALVGGSMLLAGEREARTLPFLDLLQPYRIGVWASKVLAGLLMGGHMGGLFGLILWLSPLADSLPSRWLVWLPLLIFLDGLPWALAASALCRSVLPSVGLACVGFLLSWVFSSFFALPNVPPAYLLTSRLALDLLALGVSALMFCQPEPDGPPDRSGMSLAKELLLPRLATQAGYFRVVGWLCWQQGRGLLIGLSMAAVVAGFVLAPLFVQTWPLGTLVIGLLCGLAVWRDEQIGGQSKYLGDQRLPLRRLWLGKMVFWLAAAVFVTLLAGLCCRLSFGVATWHGSGAHSETAELARRLRGQVNIELYLTMWLLYGFAVAQLAVLIWRKTVVTFVLALMGAAGLAGLWAPSLTVGGLSAWQVLLPPLGWLLTSGLLLWAWAGPGLTGRRPALILATCSLLTAGWITTCLLWRVWEVPPSERTLNVEAARAAYPTAEKNPAPRQLQLAVGVSTTRADDPAARPMAPLQPLPLLPEQRRPTGPAALTPDSAIEEGMNRVMATGWEAAPPALRPWLDEAFAGNWVGPLEEAALLPLAVFDDPALGRTPGGTETLARLRWLAAVFATRAVQAQVQGRPEEAVRRLATALALSRHLRHRSPLQTFDIGVRAERWPLEAAERVALGLLQDAPTEARLLLNVLSAHEDALPPLEWNLEAEFLLAAQRLDHLGMMGGSIEDGSSAWHWYNQALTVSLQAPWERARADRLFQRAFAHAHASLFDATPPPIDLPLRRSWLRFFVNQNWPQARLQHESNLARLRGLRLILALALYQRDHGVPALELKALAPHYLASVPADPFTRDAFGYRVAGPNETLEVFDAPAEPLAEGQGLIWSGGPDLINEGGRLQSRNRSFTRRLGSSAGDWIFLVPSAAR